MPALSSIWSRLRELGLSWHLRVQCNGRLRARLRGLRAILPSGVRWRA